METINLRRKALLKALATFSKSIEIYDKYKNHELYELIRDSVIKRFEYSIDTFWKYLKDYIALEHKIVPEIISAKAIFRACLNQNLITKSEFDVLLSMIDDRNLTAHAYNEELASGISYRARGYYNLMLHILNRVK